GVDGHHRDGAMPWRPPCCGGANGWRERSDRARLRPPGKRYNFGLGAHGGDSVYGSGASHDRMRSCSYAYAVAAARDEIPSLVKMLLRCRAMVFSLTNSSSAIAWFVIPVETARITCTSRGVSDPEPGTSDPTSNVETPTRSGCAPR